MITIEDIKEFFSVESNDTDKDYADFSKLSLHEKIQNGKAIDKLYFDKDFKKSEQDDEIRLLHTETNFSEFKIGDAVNLYKQEGLSYICECKISDFRENGDIEISIDSYNFFSSIDSYVDIPLVIVKAKVSMRNFFSDFCRNPKFYEKEYFQNHLINSIPPVEFSRNLEEGFAENKKAFQDNLGIELNISQLHAFTKSELAKNYFLIQGPPGTGKSFLLATHILDCILTKKKIIVVAPTHMAINNLLLKVAEYLYAGIQDKEFAKQLIGLSIFKCGQPHNAKDLSVSIDRKSIRIHNIPYLNVSTFNEWTYEDNNGNENEYPWGYVIGMTSYSLQSRRARGLIFDELIIDEAGQLTIPIALMAMVTYKKVILAGDHKQLPPIISENIENDELRHSIFEHLVRPYNSVMLDVSFRMNDIICSLVSDLFYDGKLQSYNGSARLETTLSTPLYSKDNPIVLLDCPDNGKQTSKCEAEYAIKIIVTYIKNGIKPEDIAVLAPFRAQCALIRRLLMEHLTKDERDKIIIDTVDRMQGQERQIIIYSFTSGDVEYMKQMENFLYSPNKLNVAFSRAKNKLILLANNNSLKKINNNLINRMLQLNYITKL